MSLDTLFIFLVKLFLNKKKKNNIPAVLSKTLRIQERKAPLEFDMSFNNHHFTP